MKRFTESGRKSISDKNWYAALTSALLIPDICGSLEQPGPGKSQKRYEEWCRKWLQPKFTFEMGRGRPPQVFLSAENCFQARCSIIHSGQAEIAEQKRKEFDRFEFFSDGPHLNLMGVSTSHGAAKDSYLQIRVDKFCEAVFDAAEEWDRATQNDEAIQAEKKKLLVIREPGAIIGPIMFG